MRERIRPLLLGLLVAASWLGTTGCPDSCDVACGKLEFCGLLGDASRSHCIDRCEDAPADGASRCADCLDNTGCGTIAGDRCDEPCAGVVEIEKD